MANRASGLTSGGVDLLEEEKIVVNNLKDVSDLRRATNADLFDDVHPVPPHSSTVHNVHSDEKLNDAVSNNDNDFTVSDDDTNVKVAALRASELRGPWFNAVIEGTPVSCAADTFCPKNLISDKLARAFGLTVDGDGGEIYGVGDGSLRLIGSTTTQVQVGSTSKEVEFQVSPDIEDFAFFGFAEQTRWGFVVDTTRRRISFTDEEVPYFASRADSLSYASRFAPMREQSSKAPKVVLESSIVVPPSTGSPYLTRGKVVDFDRSKFGDEVMFDPTNLKDRYGMTGPRIVQRVDDSGVVSILINNPFPVPIKLHRCAFVGHLYDAKVEKDDPKVMGDQEDVSPDEHPIDKLEELSSRPFEGKWTPERKEMVLQMLKRKYRALSRGDHDQGRTDWIEFSLELKPDCPGPVADPQRGYSIHKREAIDKVVEDLLEKDFIEAASSAWRAHPVLTSKKDPETGEQIPNKRFCVDYRSLNAHTVKWSRLICKVPEVLDSMSGATWFSSIDLVGAYHQVPIEKKSRPMTAFCVPGGRQFCWKVVPFGLVNAGACFSQLMDMVLSGLSYQCALAYLDDVIIWSSSFEQHLQDVEKVLERLELAGLKARPSKCSFFVNEVRILGHVVNEQGVKPDPMKTKAVEQWPVPEDAKELVSFLAFCNYYRRFVKQFSKVAHPLQKLTHDGVKWEWGRPQQEAFEALKRALCSEPVMALPDLSKPWVIDTDWSKKGIAWVLQQEGADKKLHPVVYGSRSLSKAEQKFGSTRGEFLALFEGVTSSRHYLLGGNFTVRCDNKALTYLKSYRDLTHRTARALELLADYGDFKIQYIPGKKNVVADLLSRVPWKETSFKKIDVNEMLAPVMTRSSKKGNVVEEDLELKEPAGPRDWVKSQAADSDVSRLKKWLKDGDRPSHQETSAFSPTLKSYWATFPQFKLVGGVVCRIWTDAMGGPDRTLKVVPDQWRDRLLTGFHDDLGHPGVTRLNATLRSKYYWHGMTLDCQRHVATCKVCQVVKPNRVRAPLQQHPLSFFNQRTFFDIKGPLSQSRRGNRYYLVVVDGFSKWTAILPLPDIEATTVFQKLYDEWICQNGCPVSLHSDRGSSLTGKVAKAVVDMLNIRQTTTVSHHQMGNGQAETKVKASIAVISTILNAENSLDWDLACPKTALALNTTVNSVTGQTPWLIKHGQGEEVILPVDLAVSNVPNDKDLDVVVRGLRDTQRRIFKKVVDATGGNLRRQKRNYDRLVAGPELTVGDLVRYEEHRVSELDKSFVPHFRDTLFAVEEVCAEGVNYRIKSTNLEKPVGMVVHYNQLKKVEQPRAETRPARIVGQPERLGDYDSSDGIPRIN